MGRPFLVKYLVSELHSAECRLMPKLLSDEKAVRRSYESQAGKPLDLENPQTFSEKLQWYKLRYRDPLMEQCADKIAVRDYVSACGFADSLNEIYAVYDNVKDIDLDALPPQFVLKAAHGSHMNVIVKDRSRLNWHQEKMMLRSWLRQDIAWSGREWVYKNLPKRLLAEKYLEDASGDLCDYKFFCFNGRPTYMQLEVGRFSGHHARNFYDMDWNLQPFGKDLPCDPDAKVEKPEHFEEMKKMAEKLAQPFQFVRVDLYEAQGKVYFGELTFFPAGGRPNFKPPEYDLIVGNQWELVPQAPESEKK